MKENFKIAILLPTYKNDKIPYVKLSIDSILNQSYKNFHLYVGVDGSIDVDLNETLKDYEKEECISVIRFKENRGLAVVLNDLLNICFNEGYDYIARMDADDISMPNRLEKQLSYLINNKDVDVVGGAIEEIDENGNSRGKIIYYPESPKECYEFFARRNPHAHPAVMFRKSFFDKAGCKYRPEYRQNQDTMLWLDGMKKGTKHANIQDIVLKFRFTNSLFKNRRNGWNFAKKQLEDRIMINKELGYGLNAKTFGYLMFILLVSPTWIKKVAYRIFR